MTTVQLVSVADGKCLTHRDGKGDDDTYGWDTFRMQDCVEGSPRQMITFGTDNLIKYNDRCFLVADRGDYCSGWPDDFQVLPCNEAWGTQCRKRETFTFDKLGKGPFRIKNSGYHKDRGFINRDGILRHLVVNTDNNDSAWITLPEKNECDALGIPLSQCTPEARDRAFCKDVQNMGTDRCKEYCENNDCDDAMIAYCAARPDDLQYCGCLNVPKRHKELGLDAKPKCHHVPCNNGVAYQTMRQRNDQTGCPPLNICNQNVSNPGEFQQVENSLNTTCIINGEKQEVKVPKPQQPKTPNVPGQQRSTWVIVAIIMTILLCLSASMAAVVFLF